MNFFKIIIISVFFILLSKVSMADSHDKEQNIIEKAKEINKKIKEKQANAQKNISSEINDEAVFEKNGNSFLVINFNNQITESTK